MTMEPNRRCSVRMPGSAARGDERDSGSSSRFSAILRLARMTPDRAIAISLAFRMFPSTWRFALGDGGLPVSPKRFSFWISAMDHHPIPTHRRRPNPDEARCTAQAGRSGSATVADRRRKRGIRSALPMVGFGLALVRWFLLDSSPTREWVALPVGLFGKGIVHIALLAMPEIAMRFNGLGDLARFPFLRQSRQSASIWQCAIPLYPMARKRTTPFQPFPFLRITTPYNRTTQNPPQWGKFRKLGCAQQACSGTVAAESGRKGILGFPTKKRVGFATLHWFANWISFPIPTGFPT